MKRRNFSAKFFIAKSPKAAISIGLAAEQRIAVGLKKRVCSTRQYPGRPNFGPPSGD
jgi:hypothetical protein